MSQLLNCWVSSMARVCATMSDRWNWFTLCVKCESVYAKYGNQGTDEIPTDPCDDDDPLEIFDVVNVDVNVMRFVVYILWLKRQPHSFEQYLDVKQWTADLIEVINIAKCNRGYLLTVVEVFSKYAWVEPVKNKTGKAVTNAMAKILKRGEGRKPINLQTDNGKEFYNKTFQALMTTWYSSFFHQ